MQRNARAVGLGLAAFGLGLGALLLWIFVLRDPPPSDEREEKKKQPLDIDLVGGTILVYEIDKPEPMASPVKVDELAAALKKRIDPTDILEVKVRPLGETRVEIILPVGGDKHKDDVDDVKDRLRQVGALEFRILANGRDDKEAIGAARVWFEMVAKDWRELIRAASEQYPEIAKDKPGRKESLLRIPCGDLDGLKDLIVMAHSAARGVEEWLSKSAEDLKALKDFRERCLQGRLPAPVNREGSPFFTIKLNDGEHRVRYEWIPFSKQKRKSLQLDAESQDKEPYQRVARARAAGMFIDGNEIVMPDGKSISCPAVLGRDEMVIPLFSFQYTNAKIMSLADQGLVYCALARVEEPGKSVGGADLDKVEEGKDQRDREAVNLHFSEAGGEKLFQLTKANSPITEQKERHLAVVLDGQIIIAPVLRDAIRSKVVLSGVFTPKETDRLVRILRSGALPAALKPQPVSETTVGPKAKR